VPEKGQMNEVARTLATIPSQMSQAIEGMERERSSENELSSVLDSFREIVDGRHNSLAWEGSGGDEVRNGEPVEHCMNE